MCTILGVSRPELLIGKNFDSIASNGMVFTNCRGMKKQSLVMPNQTPLEWVSRFGSVTFSQSGKGMPVSGMNERGFIVEQATLPGTVYPRADSRGEVSCLEATQYLLDTCETTAQAIEAFANFRISQTSWVIHFFFCDAVGNIALVEFIDGEMIVCPKHKMAHLALTNSRYADLCENYLNKPDPAWNEYQRNSQKRFDLVAERLGETANASITGLFTLLDEAARPDTRWSCVYENQRKKLYFKSVYSSGEIDVCDIDYAKGAPSLLFDLESEQPFSWQSYTQRDNRRNIAGFYGNDSIIQMMNLPDADFMVDIFDNHIETIERQITNQ